MLIARITILEQSSASDDYDTENGVGHADDVEPVEVDAVEIDYIGVAVDRHVQRLVQSALDEFGCGQWDGGNVAYDHDGSHMATDGTIMTRYAVITKCV
jgi:hypothetical protein